MTSGLVTVAYLAAGVLFILSLGGLSNQETARRGNSMGMIGMLIAIIGTALSKDVTGYPVLIGALAVGGVIGALLAARVEMTSMPQLVAILHSFVGLAAVLVGFATFLDPAQHLDGAAAIIHDIEIYVGIFIGALTFTGSVAAFGKLQGVLGSKPLLLPGRHFMNLALMFVCVVLGYQFVAGTAEPLVPLVTMTALSSLLGVHLVMAIGGADMPVVVSMLNSYSGWAAAAAGFMLSNDLLIITGALVGSSGAILSYIMCAAMNRSFVSVILGGFGESGGVTSTMQVEGEVTSVDVKETARLMLEAKNIVIVPGYGMAVAQAQHPLFEVTQLLRKKGKNVRFAIHPVAGR